MEVTARTLLPLAPVALVEGLPMLHGAVLLALGRQGKDLRVALVLATQPLTQTAGAVVVRGLSGGPLTQTLPQVPEVAGFLPQ